MPPRGSAAKALAREDRAMRGTFPRPAMRPLTTGEAEADLVVGVAESLVEAEYTSLVIKFEQIKAISFFTRGNDEAFRLLVPTLPVRAERVTDGEARDFADIRRVANIQHCKAVEIGHALNKVTSDDCWNAAEIAWKLVDQFGDGPWRVESSDALDAARQCLDIYRAVGRDACFLGRHIAVACWTWIKAIGAEQLKVRQAEHLIGVARQQVGILHRAVGDQDAVDFGQDGKAVRQEAIVGQRRVRTADRSDNHPTVVDLDQPACFATHHRCMIGMAAIIGELERGEHVAIGQAQEAVRHAVAAHTLKTDGYLGREWFAQVEDNRLIGVVVVGTDFMSVPTLATSLP